jgi:hypothetical protein
MSETFQQKTERNFRVKARYDQLMGEGKHGHYETMFHVVREEIEQFVPVTAEELTHALGNKPSFTLEVWVKAMLEELGPLYRQRKT